ncbi:unnamed protein product [Calypogeia fissa]
MSFSVICGILLLFWCDPMMENALEPGSTHISDAEYEAIWSDLWNQEDDVAFYLAAVLDRDLHGTNIVEDFDPSSCYGDSLAVPFSGTACPEWLLVDVTQLVTMASSGLDDALIS